MQLLLLTAHMVKYDPLGAQKEWMNEICCGKWNAKKINVILVNVYILVYVGRDLMTIDTCGSWGENRRYTRPKKALFTEVCMTPFLTCVFSTRTHLCPHRPEAAGHVWPVWRAHHQVGILLHHLHHQNAYSVPLLLVKSGHMYGCVSRLCAIQDTLVNVQFVGLQLTIISWFNYPKWCEVSFVCFSLFILKRYMHEPNIRFLKH